MHRLVAYVTVFIAMDFDKTNLQEEDKPNLNFEIG
jgi:hypothetical protein